MQNIQSVKKNIQKRIKTNLLLSEYRQIAREENESRKIVDEELEKDLNIIENEEQRKRLKTMKDEMIHVSEIILLNIRKYINYADRLIADLPQSAETDFIDVAKQMINEEVHKILHPFNEVKEFKVSNDESDFFDNPTGNIVVKEHLQLLEKNLQAGYARELELINLIEEEEKKYNELKEQYDNSAYGCSTDRLSEKEFK